MIKKIIMIFMIMIMLSGCFKKQANHELNTLEDAISFYRVFIDAYTKKDQTSMMAYLAIDINEHMLYKSDLSNIYDNLSYEPPNYQLTNDLYHAFIKGFDQHLDGADLSLNQTSVTIDPFGVSGIIEIDLLFEDEKLIIYKQYISNNAYQYNIYEYFMFRNEQGLTYFNYGQLVYDEENQDIVSFMYLDTLEHFSTRLIYHHMHANKLIHDYKSFTGDTTFSYIIDQDIRTFSLFDYASDFGYAISYRLEPEKTIHHLIMYFYQDYKWMLTVDKTSFYRLDYNLMEVSNWTSIRWDDENQNIVSLHRSDDYIINQSDFIIINQMDQNIPLIGVTYGDQLSINHDLSQFGLIFDHITYEEILQKEQLIISSNAHASFDIYDVPTDCIPNYDEYYMFMMNHFINPTTK